LTRQQIAFVEAYLGPCSGNAAAAARIAGYKNPATRGCQLLGDRAVRAAIDERLRASAMSADEVLARLTEQAKGLPGPCYQLTDAGTLKINWAAVRALNLLHLVQEVMDTQYGQRVKLADPQRALEMLARFHGVAGEKQHVTLLQKVSLEVQQLPDADLLAIIAGHGAAQYPAALCAGGSEASGLGDPDTIDAEFLPADPTPEAA